MKYGCISHESFSYPYISSKHSTFFFFEMLMVYGRKVN